MGVAIRISLLASLLAVSAACAFDRGWARTDDAAVATFDPARDYFPEPASFRHSAQLSASYHRSYKRARLVTRGLGEEFNYVFVQRGAPMPTLAASDIVVQVPVQRYSLGTYRYGGAAEALGVTDRIVGFGNHTHATAPAILRLFETGVLQRNFDLEAVANRGTEAHFNWYATSAYSRVDESWERMGALVIPAAEHMEPTPLARAEWVKFFAMFFNEEAAANALFYGIETRYRAAEQLVSGVTARPRVFVNLPQGDAWNVYGGRNQLARIITDAGGDYVWSDNPSEESGTTVHYEAALDRGLDADVWLMGADGSFGASIANLSLGNPRFAAFRSVRNGRVFINHKNYPFGPNPWWDYALIKPDEDLKDLISILHPELLPDRDMAFWRPLDLASERKETTRR